MKETGTLIRWNQEKGYGFIRPQNGKEDIFLHIRSLPYSQRRPKLNDKLIYAIEVDEKNRYYACDAKIKGLAWSWFTLLLAATVVLSGVYFYLLVRQTLPFHPLAIYAVMSLLTVWAYGKDKRAAQAGEWRASEFRLHLLELLGGWPGGLLAQWTYRHKIRKISYQLVFWLIVAGHGGFWYYALTHPDHIHPYQQAAAEKAAAITHWTGKTLQRVVKRNETPSVPVKPSTGKRSTAMPPKQARIVEGIVKAIRPKEGIVVAFALEPGTEGIIDKSTLVNDFPTRFKQGEHLRVAIATASLDGKEKRIELVLVEK